MEKVAAVLEKTYSLILCSFAPCTTAWETLEELGEVAVEATEALTPSVWISSIQVLDCTPWGDRHEVLEGPPPPLWDIQATDALLQK